jgi:hypothetical protein
MKILVVGSGGREHAIAWRLAQSGRVQVVYVAPGNGGTASERNLQNVPITDINTLAAFAEREKVAFTVVGPEGPLAAGIVERLIALANAFVGNVRGGLAHVTMLSGAGLATVSGAAVSDASALSTILVPSLTKVYDRPFAAAIVAAAANLGPIIPPSAAMIVYAFMAGSSVSVGGLFMAGVVPGLMHTPLIEGLAAKYAAGDTEGFIAHRHKQVPMQRMGDGWDVAHAVLFLAADESRYITATEIVVDGGLVAATR